VGGQRRQVRSGLWAAMESIGGSCTGHAIEWSASVSTIRDGRTKARGSLRIGTVQCAVRQWCLPVRGPALGSLKLTAGFAAVSHSLKG